MKRIRQLLCAALVLCLLPALFPSARAAHDDAAFEGRTWEDAVAALMEEYGVDPDRVAMGYCNTVTGETHYHRGGAYMVTASMYKVPLNMVFAERVSKGEMSWDTKISGLPYSTLLEWTILNSDNDAAKKLWIRLGGYQKYRQLICPYMGVEIKTVDKMFWKNNYFTPEQMIHCLTLLHSDPERFPKIEETMKRAEPERWFNAHKQDYEIAHKYGYYAEKNHLYVNDCAICYTDDPICIVLFTDSIGSRATSFMADYCTLMCDYAQYHTKLRLTEEAKEHAEERLAEAVSVLEEARAAVNAALSSLDPLAPEKDAPSAASRSLDSARSGQLVDVSVIEPSTQQLALCALILLAAAAALVAVLLGARRGRIAGGWGAVTVLLAALALGLSVMAPTLGELFHRPEGDPREAVSGFFDALIAEDYDAAYVRLNGYSSLGLEKKTESEVSQQVLDVLRRSYDYRLDGDCIMDKTHAAQRVLLQHLDLPALQSDLKQATEAALESKVQVLSRAELYDEDGSYLPEVTSAAYAEAVSELLTHPGDYMCVTELDLELVYTENGWQLLDSPALFTALCGNPAARGGATNG